MEVFGNVSKGNSEFEGKCVCVCGYVICTNLFLILNFAINLSLFFSYQSYFLIIIYLYMKIYKIYIFCFREKNHIKKILDATFEIL